VGAPVEDKLVGFGNKVAPIGAPKENINLAFPSPNGRDMGGQTFFFSTPSLKNLLSDPQILTDSKLYGDSPKTLKIWSNYDEWIRDISQNVLTLA